MLITQQSDDGKKRKGSGTTEEYGVKEQLLTDIVSLVKDADMQKQQKKQAAEEKCAEDAEASKTLRASGEGGRKPVAFYDALAGMDPCSTDSNARYMYVYMVYSSLQILKSPSASG